MCFHTRVARVADNPLRAERMCRFVFPSWTFEQPLAARFPLGRGLGWGASKEIDPGPQQIPEPSPEPPPFLLAPHGPAGAPPPPADLSFPNGDDFLCSGLLPCSSPEGPIKDETGPGHGPALALPAVQTYCACRVTRPGSRLTQSQAAGSGRVVG